MLGLLSSHNMKVCSHFQGLGILPIDIPHFCTDRYQMEESPFTFRGRFRVSAIPAQKGQQIVAAVIGA